MKEFKVGDKVWISGKGNGEVVEVLSNESYPIAVEFKHDEETFTLDGKTYESDDHRSLFHGHDLQIIGEVLPKRTEKRWVNFYSAEHSVVLHKSEKSALRDVRTDGQTIEIEVVI